MFYQKILYHSLFGYLSNSFSAWTRAHKIHLMEDDSVIYSKCSWIKPQVSSWAAVTLSWGFLDHCHVGINLSLVLKNNWISINEWKIISPKIKIIYTEVHNKCHNKGDFFTTGYTGLTLSLMCIRCSKPFCTNTNVSCFETPFQRKFL